MAMISFQLKEMLKSLRNLYSSLFVCYYIPYLCVVKVKGPLDNGAFELNGLTFKELYSTLLLVYSAFVLTGICPYLHNDSFQSLQSNYFSRIRVSQIGSREGIGPS